MQALQGHKGCTSTTLQDLKLPVCQWLLAACRGLFKRLEWPLTSILTELLNCCTEAAIYIEKDIVTKLFCT